jgi:hypothetical protein
MRIPLYWAPAAANNVLVIASGQPKVAKAEGNVSTPTPIKFARMTTAYKERESELSG